MSDLILFSGECAFVAGADSLERIPPATLPEIAFAGRSNVGKSSLINAITNRKALARTSHTPGRTQQLNFFDVQGQFLLVDMPGYGYAKVSKKQREEWNKVMRAYLRGRVTLRCVFVLVDARHGLKESDIEMMNMLNETAVPYRILLTKSDELKKSEYEGVLEVTSAALKKHPAAFPEPTLCSAHKKQGLENIRDVILSVL
jgi:GTP-binding protein